MNFLGTNWVLKLDERKKGGRRMCHFLKLKLKVNKGTQLKKELQVWVFALQLLYRGTIWNCEETAENRRFPPNFFL